MLKAKGWVKKIVTYVKMTEKALKTKMYMTVSCFAQPDFYRTLIKCPEYMTVLEALVRTIEYNKQEIREPVQFRGEVVCLLSAIFVIDIESLNL